MRVYLAQHAKAFSSEEDPSRSLTEEGRSEAEKVARFIKPLNLSVDLLWHSGKKRAEQTAEIFAQALNIGKGLSMHPGLGPNDDVAPLADDLACQENDIMIVGHLPFLARLASLLLTGSPEAAVVSFTNAGIVCMQRGEGNRWCIEWALIPQILH